MLITVVPKDQEWVLVGVIVIVGEAPAEWDVGATLDAWIMGLSVELAVPPRFMLAFVECPEPTVLREPIAVEFVVAGMLVF